MAALKPPVIPNGRFTIVNRQTGEHRTFRIETQPADAAFAPGKRVLGLLTGPENEADYEGFGFVDDDGIRVWAKKREAPPGHHSAFEVMAAMLWSLAVENVYSPWAARGYALLEEGRCVRCGRVLTEPESLRTGIGPVCAGRS